MTKRYSTLGQKFQRGRRAERHEGYGHLLSLIEGRKLGDLVAYLSRLRLQGSQAADPLSRNLLESTYHLGMAWVHSLQAEHPPADTDRQDRLEDQLRSLCLSLHDLATEPKIPAGQAEGMKSCGPLTMFMQRLLDYFSFEKPVAEISTASALDAVPIGAADIEKPVEGPISVAREAHGLASKGPCGCSDPPGCMSIYAFGSFRVCLNGEFVREWRNAKSKMLFKYLVAHKRCSIAKECLMELFWPNNDPECARNNLNVAIYNIRQVLKGHVQGRHVIIYRDGHYGLSPEFRIWTDFEAFDQVLDRAQVHERGGDLDQQIAALGELDELYGGDFLEEDRFEAWVSPLRQRYQDLYKAAIEMRAELYFDRRHYDRSLNMYKKINLIDPCDEQAHRRLMTCYVRLGQSHLAMRQFNSCVEALAREIDFAPDEATIGLFERIRRREPV